jgi:hypothetical protein
MPIENSIVMEDRITNGNMNRCYGWKEGAAHNWYSDRKANDNYRIQ